LLLDHDHEATVSTPAGSELDALFREARRRQRRRWAVRAAAAIAVVGCAVVLASTIGSGGVRRTITERGRLEGGLPMGAVVPLRTAGPLAVAPDGAVYVADVASHRVLVRLPGGRFRVIAGTGSAGFSGDGGPATRAELSTITDLAVSPTGSLYIAAGGRVRVVAADGVIRTIAGDGRRARRVANGTGELSASLGSPRTLGAGLSWLAIAFSPQGQLYLSTGSQILRLTSRRTLVPVRDVVSTGPRFLRGDLRSFGPLAVDGQGNIDVSGVNGWAIWQLAPSGKATEVADAASARRSGGNYSVLERGPDGSVYGEDGPTMLLIQGHRLVRVFTFTSRVAGEFFWLNYFAFGPHGTIYADELPGGNGFEARQQLVSLRHRGVTLLWEQPKKSNG